MERRTRRTVGTLGLVVGTTTLLIGLMPASASAASVVPTQPVFQGNATCAQLNLAASEEFKLAEDDLTNGTHTLGLLEVTISNLTEHSFDWTSNFPVSSVFVKAGNAGNLYTYNPPSFGDTNLVPPGQQAISHISFCFVTGTTPSSSTSSTTSTTQPTTTTSTTAPTTTTTQATTTTTAPTTTTTQPTTTTTAPTTTTTTAPTTTTTTAPTTTTTTAPTTTTTTAPTTTTTEGTTTTTEGTTTTAPTTSTTQGTTSTTTPVVVTTTAAPTTTSTTVGVEVLPTSIVQTTTTTDPGKATTTTTAPTEVAGVVLARTGAESRTLLLLAGFLLVVGGAMLYSSASLTER